MDSNAIENPWREMRKVISKAKQIQEAADDSAASMARILNGRLRQVGDRDVLRHLKRELRDFDMVTGRWKK
jgi:hypothetical protein